MTELEQTIVSHDPTTQKMGRAECEFALDLSRRKEATSKPPNGLVVSSDDEVRQALAESLGECGLTCVLASTVAETWTTVARREVAVVVCNDWLPDCSYTDIVNRVGKSSARIPVVVVSRVGDWPEYLSAVCAGAFDYMAYPPIRGELQRVIRDALMSNRQQLEGVDVI